MFALFSSFTISVYPLFICTLLFLFQLLLFFSFRSLFPLFISTPFPFPFVFFIFLSSVSVPLCLLIARNVRTRFLSNIFTCIVFKSFLFSLSSFSPVFPFSFSLCLVSVTGYSISVRFLYWSSFFFLKLVILLVFLNWQAFVFLFLVLVFFFFRFRSLDWLSFPYVSLAGSLFCLPACLSFPYPLVPNNICPSLCREGNNRARR